MNDVIDYSDRRMVVITDPHIKVDETFNVYTKGFDIDMEVSENSTTAKNIFIK